MKHKKNGLFREITEKEYFENRHKIPFVNNWDFHEEKIDNRKSEEVINDQNGEIDDILKQNKPTRKQKANNN